MFEVTRSRRFMSPPVTDENPEIKRLAAIELVSRRVELNPGLLNPGQSSFWREVWMIVSFILFHLSNNPSSLRSQVTFWQRQQMLQNVRVPWSLADHLIIRIDSSPSTSVYKEGNWNPEKEADWTLTISQRQSWYCNQGFLVKFSALVPAFFGLSNSYDSIYLLCWLISYNFII